MAETKKEAPTETTQGMSPSRVGFVALLLGLATAGIGTSLIEKAHREKNEMADREAVAIAKAAQAEALTVKALAAMEDMKLSQARRDLADEMFPLPSGPFGVSPSEAAVNVQIPPPPPRMNEILSTAEMAEADRWTEDGLPKMHSAEAAKLLEAAKLKESEQDIIGALKLLDEANELQPDHPAILYRLGIVFDKVGKKKSAVTYFQTVAAMEERAGELASLSLHYLHGKDPAALPSGLTNRPLSIGPAFHEVSKDDNGQRTVRLSLSIRAAAGDEIDPYEVRPEIYFFDLVNGVEVEACDGSQPPVEEVNPWRSETPDYKEPSEELLDVVYHIPYLDDGAEREFFGFVVKLYYRDEIQDVLVEPRILVELLSNRRGGGNEGELDATLFGN
ncbi:MAG: hypothetical protein GWQ05_21920 [Verrucomicrobiaceae bacterium]|nr:hypothetical protein [Verrucomicrobiaceae bacterium]